MKNYNKYLKYKNKYLKLKQYGGEKNIKIFHNGNWKNINNDLRTNILDFINIEESLKQNFKLSKDYIEKQYDNIKIRIKYLFITNNFTQYNIKFKKNNPINNSIIEIFVEDNWVKPRDYQDKTIKIFIRNNEEDTVFYNNITYENILSMDYYKNFIKNAKLFKYNDSNENLGDIFFKIQKKYYIVFDDGIEKEIRIKKVKTICNILRNVNPNKNFNLNKLINTNILQIIEKFKNTNLENILKVYEMEMFDSNVKDFLISINNNTEIRNNINDSMKLFIYNYTDINDILKSLIYRYPVYFGEPRYDYFKDKEINDILGYTIKNIEEVDDICRYGILGKCYKIDHSTFWMYHVWGINLEKVETTDYKIYYNDIIQNYNKIVNKYYTMYKKIIDSVYQAAKSLLNESNTVHIKFPLVGMGAFLETINNKEIKQKIINKLLYFIYNKFIRKNNNDRILFTISIYVNDAFLNNNGITYDNFYIYYQNSIYHRLNFLDFFNECKIVDNNIESFRHKFIWNGFSNFKNNFADNDLFDTSNINQTDILMLVNAWDPKSFIGNGLKYDGTIDGFSVAGHGSGTKLINSSYFHNPFLSPSLLDSNNWIYLKNSKL